MNGMPGWALALCLLVTGGAVLGFMLTLAAAVRGEAEAGELRRKVDALRQYQRRRLMAQSEYKGVEHQVDVDVAG